MSNFIEANTIPVTLEHLKNDCITPVFTKDNEVTISHNNFIESVYDATKTLFSGSRVSDPEIRVSHPVKGRIPEAIHKKASELTKEEETLYYDRMMFCIEVPTIQNTIDGNTLNLTVGGVRAYSETKLYGRKSSEVFKIFIGFKNLVCCNLCVFTDGYKAALETMNIDGVYNDAYKMFMNFDVDKNLTQLTRMYEYGLSEEQFAQFLGRARMYQHLPTKEMKALPEMKITDTQVNLIAKSYYKDENFGINSTSHDYISMWQFYNLVTGANKSSYIDTFLDRANNAREFSLGVCDALDGKGDYKWFIN